MKSIWSCETHKSESEIKNNCLDNQEHMHNAVTSQPLQEPARTIDPIWGLTVLGISKNIFLFLKNLPKQRIWSQKELIQLFL